MKSILLLASIALAGCASYNLPPEPYREPYPEPHREPERDERVERPRRVAASAIGLPSSWWRDARLAEPLALSSDQYQRLEALSGEQEEIDRLEEDAQRATRELHDALQAKSATSPGILAAGKRVRELRDTLLDRQIALLAAQREILTDAQWAALQDALANEWREGRPERRERMREPGGFGRRRPGGVW